MHKEIKFWKLDLNKSNIMFIRDVYWHDFSMILVSS